MQQLSTLCTKRKKKKRQRFHCVENWQLSVNFLYWLSIFCGRLFIKSLLANVERNMNSAVVILRPPSPKLCEREQIHEFEFEAK